MGPFPLRRHGGRTTGAGRAGGLLAAAILLVLAVLVATASAATPGTVRLLSDQPSYGAQIRITTPEGGSFQADPGRYTVRVTPDGGAAAEFAAWCVDRTRSIDLGIDYPVTLLLAADDPALDAAAAREAGWLATQADGLIAAAADPGREAAAIQVAVWQLTGQAKDVVAVTPDAALNARVRALRDAAAGRSHVTAMNVTLPATAAVGTAVEVTVTGTPGAHVSLAVTAGSGTLAADHVVVPAGGVATVALTPTAAGAVTVTARADGGRLMRVAHLPGNRTPQDVLVVVPTGLTAVATTTAATPVVPPPPTTETTPPPATVTPVPPVVTTRVRPARLASTKAAPFAVRPGRAIRYTITVRNTSRVTARNVVLTDPLPAGAYLRTRPAGATLRAGALVWRLGNIPAGAVRRRTVVLRVAADARGRIVNVAVARAANAATVRARATTRVARVAPAVLPAVTG